MHTFFILNDVHDLSRTQQEKADVVCYRKVIEVNTAASHFRAVTFNDCEDFSPLSH